MIVANVQRETFYQLAKLAFDALGVQARAVELGVFKGDNAANLLAALNPARLSLLDTWSAQDFHQAINDDDGQLPWLEPLSALNAYYGGDTSQQSFWDSLHTHVRVRFASEPRVSVVKGSSTELLAHATQTANTAGAFDFAYIDGNHRFEQVFRDLMLYSPLVAPNGIIQINDCSHSILGLRQNLGVLEAAVRFIKLGGWEPIAINANDFADLLMARKNSLMANALKELLAASNLTGYIEVPDALLANARIVRNDHKFYLSFA
ncbi:MAG: hypothetical protein RLZZ271_855 [Pseudomonadota bacterium]|jgi:predicted O-methyltransferase YrrM